MEGRSNEGGGRDKRDVGEILQGLTEGEMVKFYDDCSRAWDQRQGEVQHRGTTIMADLVVKHVGTDNTDMRILDVGCGTGSVSLKLAELGFTNFDGLDVSSEMIKVARETKFFQNLIQSFLRDCTPDVIQDDSYDLLAGLGIIAHNHMQPSDLDIMLRITKPGGFIMIVAEGLMWDIYPLYNVDMRAKIDEMVGEGRMEILEDTVDDKYLFFSDKWVKGKVFLFRKTR